MITSRHMHITIIKHSKHLDQNISCKIKKKIKHLQQNYWNIQYLNIEISNQLYRCSMYTCIRICFREVLFFIDF